MGEDRDSFRILEPEIECPFPFHIAASSNSILSLCLPRQYVLLLDLYFVFFSVPLVHNNQYLFAFFLRYQHYTYLGHYAQSLPRHFALFPSPQLGPIESQEFYAFIQMTIQGRTPISEDRNQKLNLKFLTVQSAFMLCWSSSRYLPEVHTTEETLQV